MALPLINNTATTVMGRAILSVNAFRRDITSTDKCSYLRVPTKLRLENVSRTFRRSTNNKRHSGTVIR
ncbi:hypothetical protein WN55_01232 [Dufourea novaeangliae]|uniref:Uncharacterized protein n=1 Tax=Dufourea novaeangliae TaxID=178035 RepID=A0A154NWP2_DUFNO|nr:hypothetical protein WN55_01232 [Dufourea novaeangliae]